MAKCDLCAGSCGAQELATLLAQYRIAGVQDICPSCRRWADKTKGDMLSEIPARMREAVAAKHGGPTDPRWRRAMRVARAWFSA